MDEQILDRPDPLTPHYIANDTQYNYQANEPHSDVVNRSDSDQDGAGQRTTGCLSNCARFFGDTKEGCTLKLIGLFGTSTGILFVTMTVIAIVVL